MSAVGKMPVHPSAFGKYWKLYGGTAAILTSGYFYTAVISTAVCWKIWSQTDWWNISIAVLPSLMGFSIAAFALIIAVGHERFLTVLATRPLNWGSSALEGTSAAFFHFLFMQFLALASAIIGKAIWPLAEQGAKLFGQTATSGIQLVSGGIGFFLLLYSITCALAASARIFSLSLRFGDLLERERQEDKVIASSSSDAAQSSAIQSSK